MNIPYPQTFFFQINSLCHRSFPCVNVWFIQSPGACLYFKYCLNVHMNFSLYLKLNNPPSHPNHRNPLFFFIRTFLNQTSKILRTIMGLEIHIDTTLHKTAQYVKSELSILTFILYLVDSVKDITTSYVTANQITVLRSAQEGS